MPSIFERKIHRQATAAVRSALTNGTPLPPELLDHIQTCEACQHKIENKIQGNPNTTYLQTLEETIIAVIPLNPQFGSD